MKTKSISSLKAKTKIQKHIELNQVFPDLKCP